MVNPYAVTSHVDTAERAYGDHARLVQSSFLFRVIEFDRPFEGRLRYSCWWWRQRIEINGHRVWFRISWLKIHSRAAFRIPASIDASGPEAGIEIDLTRSNGIRRFRFWIEGETVYDEFN